MRSPLAVLVALTFLVPAALAAAPLGVPQGITPEPATVLLPTPGFFCDLSRPVVDRVFPEPENTNDYVSYEEALCGLKWLEENHPDRVRVVKVTESVGWGNIAGGHDRFDVFVVEVTNFATEMTFEEKPKIVFQLSIHGNEKGGREGGLRVIEDFARGIGMASAHPDNEGLLDLLGLVFVFPNPDGWRHEELQYRHNDACYVSVTCGTVGGPGEPGVETQSFVRGNGNGVDINREWPTVGWVRERYTPMSEPEAIGLVNHLLNYTNVRYASDIHGMLNPADLATRCVSGGSPPQPTPTECDTSNPARGHFVLTMLPAGRQEPSEMAKTTRLAELVKERLNSDPYFAEWRALPGLGLWGGEFNDWGTVWDTLGYTDSGFTSDWYAQDRGLNVPGVDFELAYNHITFDNYYPGISQRINMYHVESVREIVRAFMDQAAEDLAVEIQTNGKRTAFVVNPLVVTNAANMEVTGWALENEADDAFDIAHHVFEAAPDDYWRDIRTHLKDGDADGVLDGVTAAEIRAGRLASYDNLVVAASGYAALAADPAALSAVKAFVEAGGTLLLTDGATRGLADLGAVKASDVDRFFTYAAYSDLDLAHEYAEGVRGLARQLYEPVPLGFAIQGDNSPVWFVSAAAWNGETVGTSGEGRVTVGRAPVGDGTVVFIGGFLPDPSTEFYHPYGLDSYATTYTGNRLVRNVLGWTEVVTSEPMTAESALAGASETPEGSTSEVDATRGRHRPIPAAGVLSALGVIGAVAALSLRRR